MFRVLYINILYFNIGHRGWMFRVKKDGACGGCLGLGHIGVVVNV